MAAAFPGQTQPQVREHGFAVGRGHGELVAAVGREGFVQGELFALGAGAFEDEQGRGAGRGQAQARGGPPGEPERFEPGETPAAAGGGRLPGHAHEAPAQFGRQGGPRSGAHPGLQRLDPAQLPAAGRAALEVPLEVRRLGGREHPGRVVFDDIPRASAFHGHSSPHAALSTARRRAARARLSRERTVPRGQSRTSAICS